MMRVVKTQQKYTKTDTLLSESALSRDSSIEAIFSIARMVMIFVFACFEIDSKIFFGNIREKKNKNSIKLRTTKNYVHQSLSVSAAEKIF